MRQVLRKTQIELEDFKAGDALLRMTAVPEFVSLYDQRFENTGYLKPLLFGLMITFPIGGNGKIPKHHKILNLQKY